jgi:Uma2 family endonuclease
MLPRGEGAPVAKEDAMQPRTPVPGEPPSEGDFRFGYRLRKCTLPDGSTEYEQVPLTVEDVLHPEPDDVIPVRPQHAIDCRYLVSVLRVRAAAELASQPIVYVSDDHLVDWGVPGQRDTSPDVAVFAGLRQEVGPLDGTFDLKASSGRCVLVIEVVSPDQRRENDVVHKVREYYQAGVPLYVIVDQEREDAPRYIRGFRWRSTGWEQLASDEQGLLLEPLELYLGLKEGRVVLYDAQTGRELGDYERITRELEQADRRIAEQDQALEQAIEETREQRQAREAAEKLAREQAQAREAADRVREAAEALVKEERRAREAAVGLANQERRAREATEGLVNEERRAREAAEGVANEERRARELAEGRANEERRAREAAEGLVNEERRAREAAEKLVRERIRQLEEALRALQPPS